MSFQNADHILIPLLNGDHALAQVARVEGDRALLYLTRTQTTAATGTTPMIDKQVICVLCTDVASLPDGHWPVIGYEAIPTVSPHNDTPLADMDTQDPAIVEAFVNAIHGLYPWDGFPDPDFFANLLRDPSVQPTKARLTADFPKPDPH